MADSLVQRLSAAAQAYYNGGTLLMTDDEYDAAVEQLRALDPKNPFLQEIGAPPRADAVSLPYPMPSLDKVKPGQDSLTRFIANKGPFILSEKLDGLSALWLPRSSALYLRGNGLVGQSISHLIPLGIQGLSRPSGYSAIRGEIVVAREGRSLARSWVNGIIHQKSPNRSDVKQLQFVAYEVIEPSGMPRSRQMTWLQDNGFQTPWWNQVVILRENELCELLQRQRLSGRYDTDGLVVGQDVWEPPVPLGQKLRNPKTLFAFKMPLSDQSATTTVREILWTPSSQGYLIPRIQFEPVKIGGATIQFCTGHNGRTIQEHKLGPDARIVIRRSGDVIPTLDHVVSPAPKGPSFPPEGSWTWAEGSTHIRSTDINTKENLIARIHHFCKTLGIPGTGAATAATLVEAGLISVRHLLSTPKEKYTELLGPTLGPAFYSNLRETLKKASEITLWIASSKLPRGIGETKLESLFSQEADPRNWSSAMKVSGWTEGSLSSFLATIPAYIEWRQIELSEIPFPCFAVAPKQQVLQGPQEVICFTGFRDAALEASASAKGHRLTDTVTGKTTLLVVPDGEHTATSKEKAAKEKGIRIVSKSAFLSQYI